MAVMLLTSVLLMSYYCLECLAMDLLQPYGPLMCDQLGKTPGRSITFHNHNLTCIVNYAQKDTVRQKTSTDWIHIDVTSTCKDNYLGKFDRRCESRQECGYEKGDCLDGRCSCLIGYSFNFTEGRCMEHCTKYGEDFSPYRNTGTRGCNMKNLKFRKVESCLAACTNFATCTNVEYFPLLGNCYPCDKAWTSLNDGQKEMGTSGYTLYYRHCQRENSTCT